MVKIFKTSRVHFSKLDI